MSDNNINIARSKMFFKFNQALTQYTMFWTLNDRDFWLKTGLLHGHKNKSNQIIKTIGTEEVNGINVGEFFKTVCVVNMMISPTSSSCYVVQCLNALKCFLKFLPCDKTFNGPNDFFRLAYTNHPNFKKLWLETLLCIITFINLNVNEYRQTINTIAEAQEKPVKTFNLTVKNFPQQSLSEFQPQTGLQHMRMLLES
jgi:hypothetical protein